MCIFYKIAQQKSHFTKPRLHFQEICAADYKKLTHLEKIGKEALHW